MTGPLDILEGGTGPSWWRSRWTALPPAGRRLAVVVVLLVLLGGGGVAFRSWSAERELRRAVELTTALDVVSSSTSPPGGSVRYFVRIRNDGVRPVSVTSIAATDGGLRVRMQDDGDRRVDPAQEIEIPVSARLSCGAELPAAIPAEIGIRREDGGATSRRVELQPAAVLLDVARTLCAVRPDLRELELSGPVLRTG